LGLLGFAKTLSPTYMFVLRHIILNYTRVVCHDEEQPENQDKLIDGQYS